ncbi:MAG: hemolysin family protein [gamma proteobacterium symbiont of Taylorina sp.]|nr:hemolysin family protein [gamma proteobacterium symbiont of Taylorina sp.]
MDFIILLEIVLFIILLGLSGFFSSSETALFSLDSVHLEQMKKDNNPNASLIEKLLSEPRRLIVTILIGNEFVNVTASVISTSMIIQLFGAENKLYNLFIMVPILLIFGEITPKTLAIRNRVAFAGFESRPIEIFSRMITPLRWVVRHVSDFFITMLIGKERSRGNLVTEDMVRTLAQDAVGKGALDQHEAGFIERIFEFGNKKLEDMLTPRSDITFIPFDTPILKIVETQRQTKQSRFPVYNEHRDDIIGILHARDLLDIDFGDFDKEQKALLKILRKPYFVPESKSAIELFGNFRKNKRSFALTVDEYGGITGLVTMEDLLECIFGDIPSPSDKLEQVQVQKIDNNRYLLHGTLSLDEFNDYFNSMLSESNMETVAGFVLHAFGELPDRGEIIDIQDFRFSVLNVVRNRIEELQVEKLSNSMTNEEEIISDNSPLAHCDELIDTVIEADDFDRPEKSDKESN